MSKTINALIGISQKGDATTAEVETALTGACAEVEVAEHARTDAEQPYRDGLLSLDEAALGKLVADQQAAAIRRDQASTLVAVLDEKLAVARAQDAEGERRTRHAPATKAATEATKALRSYPMLVTLRGASTPPMADRDEPSTTSSSCATAWRPCTARA